MRLPLKLGSALLVVSLLARVGFSAEQPIGQFVDAQFAFAQKQYAGLVEDMKSAPAKTQARTVEAGKLKAVGIEDWVSGFYPGVLWLVAEQTNDATLRAAAVQATAVEEPIKDFSGHHDVGFMLMCSFGQGYRVAPSPEYRAVLIQGARSLSKRYDPKVGVIKSWNSDARWKYPVIIDNMMNLELLMFAAKETGEQSFRDIAISHANHTLANHFRPDGSSYHLLDYDPNTGAVVKRQTVQGFADSSAWARGQAWGLYGFTKMYALTKDPAYLAQAVKIAEFISHHPNLPADGIPYWDFNATNIPDALRDTAAGTITCSALYQLAPFVPAEAAARYRALAERQLRALGSSSYRAGLGENGHFLLMHAVGHLPAKSEVDVPLVYADYYYLEALRLAKVAAQ